MSSLAAEPKEFVRITLTITNKDCNNFLEDEFRTEVHEILYTLYYLNLGYPWLSLSFPTIFINT